VADSNSQPADKVWPESHSAQEKALRLWLGTLAAFNRIAIFGHDLRRAPSRYKQSAAGVLRTKGR